MRRGNDRHGRAALAGRRPRAGFGALLCALAAFVLGCGVEVEAPVANSIDTSPQAAIALLRPTRGHDVRGTVRFRTLDRGVVLVESEVTGLTPGTHGYHVHVEGDCSAPDGTSAGPHYAFSGVQEEPAAHITGNLGELEADDAGTASHERRLDEARLAGPASIIGRAVVVHARGNDPGSPPDGDAGARVACGVIGRATL